MNTGADDRQWLQRCGTLTAIREDEGDGRTISAGAAAADRLIAVARAVVAAASPGQQGWALGPEPEARRACELAEDLAREGAWGPVADVPAERLEATFLQALRDAAHAVYLCRRVEHASGHCWFAAAGPQRALCGEVLVVAHTLRRGVPRAAAAVR